MHVNVFASYNVAWEAKTPEGLARRYCREVEPRRIVSLRRATLGGRRAAGCRQYFNDGRISVTILTLRKTAPWAARWIIIGADLETTLVRYERDMREFRSTLRGVWIH